MITWVGRRLPGPFEDRAGVLSEIDQGLAVIGTAHWTENFSTGAHPQDCRQNTPIKWQLWGKPCRLIAVTRMTVLRR